MTMSFHQCAISVDLDEIHHYFAIHGMKAPQESTARLVYDVALERFARFARKQGIVLTFFAVGDDLMRDEAAARVRDLFLQGHEVANHSLGHRYDLTRLSRDDMRREVELGAERIERAVGHRPVGFRAPGYTVTNELLQVVRASGAKYDSSVFPCPAYYGVKAAAMAAIRVRGRRSRSVLDSPKVLRAPTKPYRMDPESYRRGGDGLVELPIQVTPTIRFPFIGTFLTMAGARFAELLASATAKTGVVNLELHGIDLLDEHDGLQDLVGHQPDVRIPWRRKWDILERVVDVIRRHGLSFVTCEKLSESVR